jgi:hypothetical protein
MQGGVVGPVSKDARIFVGTLSWYYGEPTLSIAWARLGAGAKCDPASSQFVCGRTSVCKLSAATNDYRCTLAACSNGVDDDNDGKIDYPADPGCTSPTDDSESDPSRLPACADGIDNDGNDLVDYPADPGCSAASSDGEGFCGTPVASVLTGSALPLQVWGDTRAGASSLASTCGYTTAGGDQTYEWTVPSTGVYTVSVQGKSPSSYPYWTIRRGTCGGTAVGCWTGSSSTTQTFTKGDRLAIQIDAPSGNTGPYILGISRVSGLLAPGEPCSASSATLLCETGPCVADASGVTRCTVAACSNGADDDGDGKIDWPEDPGCSWPGDDSEVDLVTTTVCSNGRDDDGDGASDWPGDHQCVAAAGGSESFCSAAVSGALGEAPFTVTGFSSGTTSYRSVCGSYAYWNTVEHLFEFTAQHTGTFRFEAYGSNYPILLARSGTCDGPQLSCGYANGGMVDGAAVTRVDLPLSARQTIGLAVVISGPFTLKGTQLSGGLGLGATCDPASTVWTCEDGTCAVTATGGYACSLDAATPTGQQASPRRKRRRRRASLRLDRARRNDSKRNET